MGKKQNDLKCAPSNIFSEGSCIPLNLLIEMAEGYNKLNKTTQIKLYPNLETLNPKKYKLYLVAQFSKRYDKVCDNQKCWLKQEFMKQLDRNTKNHLEKHVFRPDGPNGKFTWLNTSHINEVMRQYENKYNEFKFLGAVPIDFDDLPFLGIKDLDFDMYKKQGKTKFGIIYNLDEHYKDGSHWTAGFFDIMTGRVYFFDSYGIKPDQRVRRFMRRVARYVRDKSNISPEVNHNKVRHQYGGSECGVFSLFFIIMLLVGYSFKEVCETDYKDEDINKLREIVFTS